jgi:hypothetical protein
VLSLAGLHATWPVSRRLASPQLTGRGRIYQRRQYSRPRKLAIIQIGSLRIQFAQDIWEIDLPPILSVRSCLASLA